MLTKAQNWLEKLYMLKHQQKSEKEKKFVQEHIDIMTYLVDCAEEVEASVSGLDRDLPSKPEVSK